MPSKEKHPPPPPNNKGLYCVLITGIVVLGVLAILVLFTNYTSSEITPYAATADIGEMQINEFDLDYLTITYPYEITGANYPLNSAVILAVPGNPDKTLITQNSTINKNAKHEGAFQATCKSLIDPDSNTVCAISSDKHAMKLLKSGSSDFPVFSPLEPRFSIYITAEDESGNEIKFHAHKRYGLN